MFRTRGEGRKLHAARRMGRIAARENSSRAGSAAKAPAKEIPPATQAKMNELNES